MFAQSTSDTVTQLYYLDLFVLTVRFFRKKRKSKLKKRKNVANSKNVKNVICNPAFMKIMPYAGITARHYDECPAF